MTSLSVSLTTPLLAQIEPPPNSPAPVSTTSGGTRPSQACLKSIPKTTQRLIALNPDQAISFTQSERPTLFVYLPRNEARYLELSLFNDQQQGLYQTTLSTQNQSGLIGLLLPSDAPKLVKGKNYYWTVAVVCNVNDRTEDQIIGGWIQYRELPKANSRLLPVERIKLYAKQGFWYDAFREWSDLHQKQPHHPTVKKAWTDLIQAVGLPTSLNP
ncbi:MAG: DUF928 domain-containing protein [Leptolyngbya sp. Prado105]|nr:DUF928 domain-containing protein [Leptolyngbya sp. Prado105]